MKKILLLVAAVVFSFGLKAQCPLNQAVDFTATDCHGNTIHLFDILDGGQSVLIDFFYTTCGPCQQATPKVVESYYSMGCNQNDVFYMEITPSDNDAACQTWVSRYGIEYPTIGKDGTGNSICNTYGINAYPTVILIKPDRSIVINDLWPINNASSVVTALEAQGIQQHPCSGTGVEEFESENFMVYPNPARDYVTFSGENIQEVVVYNSLGQLIDNVKAEGDVAISTSNYNNGVYFARINGVKTVRFVVTR